MSNEIPGAGMQTSLDITRLTLMPSNVIVLSIMS